MMCVLCKPFGELLHQGRYLIAFAAPAPETRGHILIAPRRHVATYFDCTNDERHALWHTVEHFQHVLEKTTGARSVDVRFSVGEGLPLQHAHVHVIPRFGDADVRTRIADVIGRALQRPVRWSAPLSRWAAAPLDVAYRTLDVFNVDPGEQLLALRSLRALRDAAEVALGGPLAIIFHTRAETARLYPDMIEEA